MDLFFVDRICKQHSDGSDVGKSMLTAMGIYGPIAQTLPPLIIGTIVQVVNMPLVRATITIQDPKSEMKNTWAALVYIYNSRGVAGLWHGVSAGILKTVPKYVTAIVVKDFMEDHLPHGDSQANAQEQIHHFLDTPGDI